MSTEVSKEVAAERIQKKLAQMYEGFYRGVQRNGYELIVLAVPRVPGNIEAVSNALDQEALVELLTAFLSKLKGSTDGDAPHEAANGSGTADADGPTSPTDGRHHGC